MIDEAYMEKVNSRLAELEHELSQPEAAKDQNSFRTLLSEHAHLKKLQGQVTRVFTLKKEEAESAAMVEDPDTDADLKEMATQELSSIREQLPDAERELTVALLPPDPDASRNSIVEIRAGTGGDEAALFAGDLFRMYGRFAETQGWKVGMIDASPATLGGFKEVVFSVEGQNVYSKLRFESGGHRVQRIPDTEASGRIHTSAATVAVLPEAEEVDEIEIKPEELRVDIFRSSGPGGQSVNTTDSAVRLTHLETGIVVQSQDERSQHRNRDKAMRVLKARLLDRYREEEQAKMADQRRTQIGSGDRSQRIRTYNFPQNRLTDHRINLTLYSLDKVIEGELGELIESLSTHHLEERMAVELDV